MGIIRVRVDGDDVEGTGSNRDKSGETAREIKEIFGGSISRVVPFDTAELAESLRGLSA